MYMCFSLTFFFYYLISFENVCSVASAFNSQKKHFNINSLAFTAQIRSFKFIIGSKDHSLSERGCKKAGQPFNFIIYSLRYENVHKFK